MQLIPIHNPTDSKFTELNIENVYNANALE